MQWKNQPLYGTIQVYDLLFSMEYKDKGYLQWKFSQLKSRWATHRRRIDVQMFDLNGK